MYEEIIKDNIEYDYLIQDRYLDRDRIEEILALILETVCTKRRTIRIAGDDHPAELVKAKFMKLNSEHIRFVLDCMQENTTKIRNIKQYMKAALFNAPSTIGSYYTSLVSHDMYGGRTIQSARSKGIPLIFDETADRYDIRFDVNDYYGGLHCGDCMEVFVRGKWKPTRMEYGDNWYLVGIRAADLSGLRVRI